MKYLSIIVGVLLVMSCTPEGVKNEKNEGKPEVAKSKVDNGVVKTVSVDTSGTPAPPPPAGEHRLTSARTAHLAVRATAR